MCVFNVATSFFSHSRCRGRARRSLPGQSHGRGGSRRLQQGGGFSDVRMEDFLSPINYYYFHPKTIDFDKLSLSLLTIKGYLMIVIYSFYLKPMIKLTSIISDLSWIITY